MMNADVMNTGVSEREALLREAQNLRAHQRLPEALHTLARLQAAYPRFSRLYQERGHCHIQQGNAPAAIDALREAVRLNPTLPASWDMLAQLFRLTGDPAQAATAAQRVATLQQLPTEIVVANSLYADADFELAEDVLRAYLGKDGDNVGALHLLARIRRDVADVDEAERLLSIVLELAPDYHAARFDYAMVLLQKQKPLAARQEAQRLLARDPDNRDYLKQYGAACLALGDHEPVIDLYGRLLSGAIAAEAADLRLWRANALKVTGRQAEAIADYRASLAARPDYGVAWFSLSNLKTYRFSHEDIARMRVAEARPATHDMDRIYLGFAIGKALEDVGDYEASWQYYMRANALRRSLSRWRPEVAQDCAQNLKRIFTTEFFAARSGWGASDPAPVFIVGLPRSGSTLIEQILASHSKVEGTQELTEIGRYAAELCGRDPDCDLPLEPDALLRLTAGQARELGERFLNETRTYRRLGRPFFIDKMPNNFWHIGLIHLILPRATLIDVRREPMACAFSNLKQLFGTTNQEFTYGVNDIARYYRTYLDIMQHWEAVLPGRVVRVPYEAVVEDIDSGVQRLLEGCGLPFEPGCLRFHDTQRSIRTPSSEQVRQPIGREGLTQWQNYAPWLEPLRNALGDAITRYRN
ncbi:tetratricopeptide repeat-containing sulfotransferase family protein [Asticcacaulis machinosus]|uniref:Sulfotransferase n=1 Tax=Asticcacaulis machinosus TaxID=2984211 RepID=A0ABT5HIB4_9CAUL|nr:tetratricopeptide repeat-containing sulfotransferase family protein [Asticcacaulis machinosus]MDC7675881.1 sulfotransferase [Asticcacaulis machinosus]